MDGVLSRLYPQWHGPSTDQPRDQVSNGVPCWTDTLFLSWSEVSMEKCAKNWKYYDTMSTTMSLQDITRVSSRLLCSARRANLIHRQILRVRVPCNRSAGNPQNVWIQSKFPLSYCRVEAGKACGMISFPWRMSSHLFIAFHPWYHPLSLCLSYVMIRQHCPVVAWPHRTYGQQGGLLKSLGAFGCQLPTKFGVLDFFHQTMNMWHALQLLSKIHHQERRQIGSVGRQCQDDTPRFWEGENCTCSCLHLFQNRIWLQIHSNTPLT